MHISQYSDLFDNILTQEEANAMITEIIEKQIKDDLFDIEDDKAPGLDGFISRVFIAAWTIVGKDVCRAVQEFFMNGKLMGEVNATIISLVPNINTSNSVSDF